MSREVAGAVLPVDRELVEEKAGALARVTARFEAALESLARCDRALEAASSEELLTQRARLREQASEWLWCLVVQREAIGIANHDSIFRFYAIPPEVRRAMGPRPRR